MKRFCSLAIAFALATASPVLAANLLPSEIVQVAWDQTDENDTGSNFAGGSAIDGSPFAARERGTDTQTDIQGVTYFKYDLSNVSAAVVADPSFTATLQLDYDSRVNNVNAMSAELNVVADANAWSNSAGSYPLATWVGPADLGGTLVGDHVVVNDVQTLAPTGQTLSIDVSQDVEDWVDGTSTNNGYVLFGDRDTFQGAGFSNGTLKLRSTLALYDFEAGTGSAGEDFDHPGNDSVDTNPFSSASRIASSGLDGGGATNIFNTAGEPNFNGTSDTGGPVTNWGNGAGADNGNYASFRITPDAGTYLLYDTISLFHSSFDGSGSFSIRVVEDPDGAAIETDIAVGVANGVTAQFFEADFEDFISNQVTEWRIYIFGAGSSGDATGFRFDDIKLTGFYVPAPAALPAGLMVIGLAAALRKRRTI